MNSIKEHLFEKVAAPLLVTVFTPIALIVASKLATGDEFSLLARVPSFVWVVVASIALAWLGAALLRRRALRRLTTDDLCQVFVAYARKQLDPVSHVGVRWKVQVPAQGRQLYPTSDPPFDLEYVEVEGPPLCPICPTELEERSRYFGGFVWSCLRCGFKMKSKRAYFQEAKRAAILARSHLATARQVRQV